MIVPILDSFSSSQRGKAISLRSHPRELALGEPPTVGSGWQKGFVEGEWEGPIVQSVKQVGITVVLFLISVNLGFGFKPLAREIAWEAQGWDNVTYSRWLIYIEHEGLFLVSLQMLEHSRPSLWGRFWLLLDPWRASFIQLKPRIIPHFVKDWSSVFQANFKGSLIAESIQDTLHLRAVDKCRIYNMTVGEQSAVETLSAFTCVFCCVMSCFIIWCLLNLTIWW